ncbi:MAG: hypothetical protein QM535_00110 [Limnohabitans sp.]|nr:hypothetical protein [Limnohabitans sp.]
MDRLTKTIAYTILSIFVFSQVEGQNNNSNFNEIIEIKTNNNNYLTGDKIFFSVFCKNKSNNKLSNFSKVAYLNIIDNSKKVVAQLKVFLDEGTANGDFFIPLTLESGIYNIACYTNYMRSFDDFSIISKPILILNPYKEAKITDTETVNKTKNNTKTSKTNTLKKFNTRSSNIFQFPENLKKTDCPNFLISIRKKDSLNKIVDNSLSENIFQIKGSKNIIPEHRGEIISGKIRSVKNTPLLKDIPISLSFPGKEFEIKMTTTDINGRFIFNLDNCISNPNIQIQIVNSQKDNFIIELDKADEIDYSNLTLTDKINITEDFRKIIEEKYTANQIENAYSKFKKDSIIKSSWKPFFDTKESKEYILNNYTRFPSVRETVIEILDGVTFSNKKGEYTIRLKDYDIYNNLDSPILTLVDGKVITDIKDLLEHNADLFEKINFINKQYYYGGNLYNGIISFTTFNQDYEIDSKSALTIFKPEIIRPLETKKYYSPSYSAQNSKNKRIPDYRYQLYWEPNYQFAQEKNTIQFSTSDLKGEFEIYIFGIDSFGKTHEYSESFMVE